MRLLLSTLIMLAFCISCNKDNTKAGKTVEIYLLKTYSTVAGRCQVDAASAVLQDNPVVRDQDIITYAKDDYQFRLTDAATRQVAAFSSGTPFAVTVDKQVIYYGIFIPAISSSSCDHSITMDVYRTDNKIKLSLGYPGLRQGLTIDDQRNNPVLLATLQKQGKLR